MFLDTDNRSAKSVDVFVERLRAIGMVADRERRDLMMSFLYVDARMFPPLLKAVGNTKDAESIEKVSRYLRERNKLRAELTLQGQAFTPDPDREKKCLKDARKVQICFRDVLSREFGIRMEQVDPAKLSSAFEAFVDGVLQLTTDEDSRLFKHGLPNGLNYFLFAEAALYFIDNGINADFWKDTLNTFVRTSEIFTQLYWDGRPRSRFYHPKYKGSRTFGEKRWKILRNTYKDRNTRRLRLDYGSIVAWAFRDLFRDP